MMPDRAIFDTSVKESFDKLLSYERIELDGFLEIFSLRFSYGMMRHPDSGFCVRLLRCSDPNIDCSIVDYGESPSEAVDRATARIIDSLTASPAYTEMILSEM